MAQRPASQSEKSELTETAKKTSMETTKRGEFGSPQWQNAEPPQRPTSA